MGGSDSTPKSAIEGDILYSASSKALARYRAKKSKSIFFDKEDRADEPKTGSTSSTP